MKKIHPLFLLTIQGLVTIKKNNYLTYTPYRQFKLPNSLRVFGCGWKPELPTNVLLRVRRHR